MGSVSGQIVQMAQIQTPKGVIAQELFDFALTVDAEQRDPNWIMEVMTCLAHNDVKSKIDLVHDGELGRSLTLAPRRLARLDSH